MTSPADNVWNNAVKMCIDKANQLAEEYGKDINVTTNNGWIPCSERLPEESGEYLTFVEYDDDTFIAIDEIFCGGILKEWNCTPNYHVIAWQPLPTPYQKGEDGCEGRLKKY